MHQRNSLGRARSCATTGLRHSLLTCFAVGLVISCGSGSSAAPEALGGGAAGEAGRATGGSGAPTEAGGSSASAAAGAAPVAGGAAGGSGGNAAAGGGGGPDSGAGAAGLAGGAGLETGGATGNANGGGGSANGASGGSSVSGCADLLLCDDFEAYAINTAPNGRWTTQARGSGKAVIDTAMAYSGTKSVHFTGTVNQGSANIIAQGAPVFPVQGNTVFVRMMMYVKGYPTTSGVHTRVARIGTSTNGADGTGYAMTTYNGTGIERINEAMVRDTSLHLTDASLKARWVCWEWELDNSAGPPASGKGKVLARLWEDGSPVTLGATSHTNLSWDPVAWQILEFGLEAYQADSQAGDFWIDDVAMATQKIGCPKK